MHLPGSSVVASNIDGKHKIIIRNSNMMSLIGYLMLNSFKIFQDGSPSEGG